ncbi:MAG: precorrin-6Y C5,15-methyltransferase (decarboxylating) subunit CbiT [Oscillospiraceae bacterium]|nr:precorrin-6Y C5,15-methyltransferase (decarboxylating) subunit CbiT [Oscillospiraceae bacterium]
MKVDVIGLGCGGPDSLTVQAAQALSRAELIVGARRLLEALPPNSAALEAEYRPERIVALLQASGAAQCAVVLSGDAGFYSGAAALLPRLEAADIPYRVLPGISSLQALSAQLGQPWQNWRLCSAHGVDCDPVEQVCLGQPCFFLTGGSVTPADLCRQLAQAGLGALAAAVGERRSCRDQRRRRGAGAVRDGGGFDPLSVLLVQAAPVSPPRAPGIPDEDWVRGQTPMTKQEVRAAALAKLAVGPSDCCWDVGAGTGSVSVEMALHCRQCWAVEEKEQAVALIEENRRRFRAWKLRVVRGKAPQALRGLPAPDAVFVGGSGGALGEILSCALQANPKARLCVSAIALETLEGACREMKGLGLEPEVAQIAVSRTRTAGSLHLLMAQNPVFLISGARP